MKKIIIIAVLFLATGCRHSRNGDVIVQIESEKYSGTAITCDYYTDLNGMWNFPVSAPCNLYKVGDTLRLTSSK